jgi:hypothetical protein
MDSKIEGAQTDAWGAVSGAIDVSEGFRSLFPRRDSDFLLLKKKKKNLTCNLYRHLTCRDNAVRVNVAERGRF